ncbi:MAG: hypothetical protein BroJett018_48380 [Chloroflexota bacterium]|nr:MAG: hypothetical protein BroJett018_48380 [Chloroflexota bacterium]
MPWGFWDFEDDGGSAVPHFTQHTAELFSAINLSTRQYIFKFALNAPTGKFGTILTWYGRSIPMRFKRILTEIPADSSR